MTYTFTKRAQDDFVEIYRYIAQDNLSIAKKIVSNVEKTCETLTRMPEMGKFSEFVQDASIRVIPVIKYKKYLIFYKINHQQILIIRILHSARDIPNIFKK